MRLFFACLLFVLLSCPASAAETPEQALIDAQNTLDAKDIHGFERIVDIRNIADKFMDLLLEDAVAPHTNLPPLIALIFSSARQSSQASANLRLLLIQEAEAFVRYGVQSGHFAGKPDRGIRGTGMFAPLFNDISLGRKEFSASGSASRTKDGQALLPAILRDGGNGNSYPLLLRMQRGAAGWRITEIANLRELWELLQNEARQQP